MSYNQPVDCKIPDGLNVGDVSNNIKKALKDCGYNKASVWIKAYGEKQIRSKMRDGTERVNKISFDICYVCLGRHREFIEALCGLRRRDIKPLVCQPRIAAGLLLVPATKVWRWDSLAFGGPPIPDTECIELSRVKHRRSYYNGFVQGRFSDEEVDDEVEEASKSEEESLEPQSTSSASHQSFPPEYMSKIQRLNDMVQERDAKIVEMEKKQEELENAHKSMREELNEMKETMEAKFSELFK
ncbi:unnamed protein product [Arabis nemorensis]|uniref:Uncharacterized protein n=1 Tax=Arabis nemorensis TaxID=586526 RepID=A0A565CF19_9BRAS|nr:unnamed protein product [Arabis nemorensis]